MGLLQWNLSIMDTIGTESVLIIEMSLFQSIMIREVPLSNNYL